MKIIRLEKREAVIEVVPDSLDDLWHLERIIEKGDLVSGQSTRKIKGEEGVKAEKLKVWVELEAEKVEFHKPSGQLRVSGKMKAMKPLEFFEADAFHSIEVEARKKIKIQKKKLLQYQIDRIHKAVKESKKPRALLIALDDESAVIAELRAYGFEVRATISAERHGKQFKQEKTKENKYFNQLFEKIKECNIKTVIIAGPGFTKNDFKNFLEEKNFEGNAIFEAISSSGEAGLNELVKRGVIEKVIEDNLVAEESMLVEKLFEEIAKGSELIAYGEEEVEKAVQRISVQRLLVSDRRFFEKREKLEEMMEMVEKGGGIISIISSEHDAGKRLEGIGGIAAFLRF